MAIRGRSIPFGTHNNNPIRYYKGAAERSEAHQFYTAAKRSGVPRMQGWIARTAAARLR